MHFLIQERVLRKIIRLNYWRKKRISQTNFLIICAALVGALGGFAAATLKVFTHAIASFLKDGIHWEYKYYLYFFFPLIGLTLCILYIRLFIRKTPFYSGIPPLIKSITHNHSKLSFHNIYSQIITSGLTVGMGGSAGLEAPSVSSGAAIGSNLGRLFGLTYREMSLLLACGGAAGISGAFNSPIAGMIFAIEVLLPSFSIPSMIPLLIGSAFASVISKMVHDEPLFASIPKDLEQTSFLLFVIFGFIAGFYVIFFSWLNEHTHRFFEKRKNKYIRILIGGLILGTLVTLFPAIYGEGYIAVQDLLDGKYHSLLSNSLFSQFEGSTWILILFALLTLLGKTWGCSVTMGCGGNGGMFGPSVGVGALLGFVFAFSINQTGWVHLNITNFMIVGMAACVSGMMHAPLTGIFLAAEITGGYTLIVPLMIVSAISYFLNKRIRKYSIYTRPLKRQGLLIQGGSQDASLLSQLLVKDLIETNFIILRTSDIVLERKDEIINSTRQIFPVIRPDATFVGFLIIEDLIKILIDTDKNKNSIDQIVQPTDYYGAIDEEMKSILQKMDRQNLRFLPIVDEQKKYLGFVTKNGIFKKYRKDLMERDRF